MRFIILFFILTLLSVPSESVFGSRSSSRSSPFRSRSSRNIGWNVPTKSKSSLSKNAKYALFTAGGLAAGVYIGNKFSNSRNNYDDLRSDRYNFCQGRFVGAPMGQPSQYFVCPMDPTDYINTQCCYNGEAGYCCPRTYGNYGARVGGGISGAIGSLLFFGAIGACIYCLCCKKKNVDPGQVEMYSPVPSNLSPGFPTIRSNLPDY